MEMKFHLPYLDSNLEGCVYVEKEAGAIRWLVWGQESYETLEYLSRVGNFPKVKRDGSGGPGLWAEDEDNHDWWSPRKMSKHIP